MMTITAPMRAEDLLSIPDDGYRYELIQGELKKMAPAGHVHGKVAFEFALHLGQYVKQNQLGRMFAAETGFVIERNPDTVRAPDVAFIGNERLHEGEESQGYWPGPPDLAVEVVSPSDTYNEVEEKALSWLEAGTLCVIIINPKKRSLAIYKPSRLVTLLSEADVLELTDLIPGWSLPVRELFIS
jgi:Uma2 family endonuclease